MTTAVDPYVDANGQPISATDVRNNIDNLKIIKNYLPEKLSDADIQKVLKILDVANITESKHESKNDLDPLDETESINLQLTDDLLSQSKIQAYNIGQTVIDKDGKEQPVNPKKFPEKAVDIVVPVQKDFNIEIFLDSETKEWDSYFVYNGHVGALSPDQMGQFFESNFYKKLQTHFSKQWPLSDELYGQLFQGIANKTMKIGRNKPITEDSIDKNGKDDKGANDRKYSPSGRKLMNFSDIGVKASSGKFTCWPPKGKEFNWSTWADWHKIKPLCRMRFKYDNGHEYGCSISAIGKDYEHRGFRSYDLTEQPPLQWLSKDENADLMKLSIFNKFISKCIQRIRQYVEMPTEEIFDKINNKEKITINDINKTKVVLKKTVKYILRRKQSDDFKWKS